MNWDKHKLFLAAVMCVLPSVAMASTVSDQLDQLLDARQTSIAKADIENRYNFVVTEKGGKTRFNVYIKLRESSFSTKSGRGQASKKEVTQKGLERLPASIRQDVLRTYENRAMISASLTLAQLRVLKQQEYVIWVEPWLRFKPQSVESHGYTGVSAVHAQGNTGAGQTIAIIDTEFSASLSISNPNVLGGRDLADNDSNFTIASGCNSASHGTQVASIAATQTGVAKDANLVLLKLVSDSNCNQVNASLDSGDIVDALDWVVDHRQEFGISVVNMSLAADLVINTVAECESYANAYNDSFQDLYDAGVVVVAAAGNTKTLTGFPGCLPTTISVGAVFDSNSLDPVDWPSYNLRTCVADECPLVEDIDPEGFSLGFVFPPGHPHAGEAYNSAIAGPMCPGRDRVTCYSSSTNSDFLDVLAPSDCASATKASGGINPCFSGTSAAAPFVSGLVALINAEAGGNCLSVEEIRQILTSSPNLITDSYSGITTPRVNASVIGDFVTAGQCDATPPVDPEEPELSVPALIAILSLIL